jgi:hypothetical protein
VAELAPDPVEELVARDPEVVPALDAPELLPPCVMLNWADCARIVFKS